MRIIKKFKKWLRQAPERKVYIEVITAMLTVPVLITVLITNLNNLNSKKDPAPTEPSKQEIILREVPSKNNPPQTSATEKKQDPETCKKEIGPISISYPQEGQTVDENPLNIIIRYDDNTYCSVVWSYRINNGSWSEYTSNSISLYDMPSGNKKFDLRVQSTVSQEQEMVTRNFIYTNSTTPIATQSAE